MLEEWKDETESKPIGQPKQNPFEVATTRRLNAAYTRIEELEKSNRIILNKLERLELSPVKTLSNDLQEGFPSPSSEPVGSSLPHPSPEVLQGNYISGEENKLEVTIVEGMSRLSLSIEDIRRMVTIINDSIGPMSRLLENSVIPGMSLSSENKQTVMLEANKRTREGSSSTNTVLPSKFSFNGKMRQNAIDYWAKRGRGDLNPDTELEKFCAHYWGNGKRMKNWNMVWVTWYSNAVGFNKKPANYNPNNDVEPIDFTQGAS